MARASSGNNNSNTPVRRRRRRGVFLNRRAKRRIGLAALVVITIVLVFAALAPTFFPVLGVQRYSELGILSSNQTIAPPTSVLVNQTFRLYGYLVNEEGTSQYYNVLVKLGGNATQVNNSTSANAPVVAQYYSTLADNQTYVFPMDLSINQTGIHWLIFELWSYHLTRASAAWNFTYTGVFDRIKLQVNSTSQGV